MTRLRQRLTDERGFTLAIAMGIMLIASLATVAAFTAARGDIKPAAQNSDRKTAYAAAESGVAYYASKLTGDPDYWEKCDQGTTSGVADPVNQPNVSTAARKWKAMSGTGRSVADFSIGLLPASGFTACSTTNDKSMLSAVDGTLQIRSTGRYHGELRTIVVKFRRQRFLNFIYFTDYETLDPLAYGGSASCAQYRASRPSSCTVIQFTDKDKVNGPLHTNDDLVYCGAPTFGRTSADSIEVSGPAPGYAQNSGCTAGTTPVFKGTFRSGQRQLQMPPTNAALKTLATTCCSGAGYLLTGTQYIRFNGNGTMTIDTPQNQAATPVVAPTTVNLPSNGVIYVQNGTCTDSNQPPAEAYTGSSGCANVYVSGSADKSVTLASEKDIIVAPTTNYAGSTLSQRFNPASTSSSWNNEDLISKGTLGSDNQITGPAQIGLIATNFVRVYHPVSSDGSANTSGVTNVRIDAAILSLQHSFIVDNYALGTPTGTLQIHGAIAQRFRGPVGTGSGTTTATGYLKDYWYDDRLRFQSPPYFLDPINAAWGVGRENELVPPV